MLSGAGLSGGFSGSNEPGLRFPPGLHKEVACGGSQRPEELRAEPSPHCRGRRCVEAEPAGHAGSRGRSSCRLQPPALHKLPVQVVWPGRPIGCQEDPGPCKIGPRARALPSRCHRRRLDAPCQRLGGSRQDFSGTEKVVGRSLAGASKLNLEDESTGEAGRMQLLDRSARGKIGRGATPSEAELPPSKPGGASRSEASSDSFSSQARAAKPGPTIYRAKAGRILGAQRAPAGQEAGPPPPPHPPPPGT